MGAKLDPEYENARKGFLRDLEQFHESRGLKWKGIPQINGKEVDLYLLYQIVTSHGGWEKINIRNEWDDLLEHFNLPRAVNGGLSLKIIYLKYLELYEKIHYLGEDVDGGRHEEEDDYDDFRHRRRYTATPSKPTHTPHTSITPGPVHVNPSIPLTDLNRAQFGMSTRLLEGADYDRLLLSLQSPLPNDQDLAISICTLLSHETKHVLKFPKAPRILDLLLAHAGVYNHCHLRELMQETYQEGRGLNHNEFWMDTVSDKESRQLLCECFVHKINHSIGIEDECVEYFEGREDDPDLSEEERWIIANRKRISSTWESDESTNNSSGVTLLDCCQECPCKGVKSDNPSNPFPAINLQQEMLYLVRKSASGDDKIGRRITQITNILRNLSFEEDNALMMASNPTLMRFMLIGADCSWGTIPQLSLDLMGNLAQHVQLKEPSIDPISCRLLSLVTNGLFSTDRFRILRSLESLRELCKKEGNEEIFKQYIRTTVFKRLCELLTISDIMLLIYTLECLLSMTGLGEAICNELARVHGSVATLVSLVTVEAQSYGPKGCILMRVVETVTGTPQSNPATITQGGAAVHQQQLSSSISQTVSGMTTVSTPIGNTVVTAPVVSIPRHTSHSPIPSFPQSLVPMVGNVTNKPNVSLPSSSTSLVSNYNPVPSFSNTSATQMSALHVQLQQQQQQQHHQLQHQQPNNINSSNNPNVQVPSPALSPSLSLSPAPSPGPPPQGPIAHFVQSQSPSPSPQPGQQHRQGESGGGLNNNNVPGMIFKPTLANNNVYTSLNTQPRNGIGGIITSSTASGSVTNMSTVTTSNSSCTFITTTMATALPVNSNNTTIALPSSTPGSTLNKPTTTTATTLSTSNVSESANVVSNQSLNQQVYIPSLSLSLVTSRGTLSEEGWAIAWLKGAFEVTSGTSIEQGESYRMYCSARQNPQAVLSLEQFIQCVKCAYGATVGPVIKHFGGSSLSFIEGIRPKIQIKPAASSAPLNVISSTIANTNTSPAVGISIYPTPSSVKSVTATSTIPTPALVTTTTPSSGLVSPVATVNQLPVSVHIPSRENKSLSPILKATLSRPPKAKNPAGVAQRQQKKLQLESMPKNTVKDGTKEKKTGKLNGIDGNLETEESSASSSINSSEESDGHGNNRILPHHPVSFQGILRNGLGSDESSKDGEKMSDELLEGKNKLKGMLIDLLERKVNPRETMNGLMSNREIRIGDKGLELVDKLEDNSNSSVGLATTTTTSTTSSGGFNAKTSSNFTNSVLESSADSQSQMTFYSTTEQQLGIKRSHCAGEDSSSPAFESEPPSKKPNLTVNGNGCLPTTVPSTEGNLLSPATAVVVSSSSNFVNRLGSTSTQSSVLQAALSSVTSISTQLPSSSSITTPSPTFSTTTTPMRLPYESKPLTNSGTTLQQQQQPSSSSIITTTTSINSSNNSNSVTPSIGLTNTSAPNQMMQLRLSVNPQNQLTFARQLVLPSGQQLYLSTTKSQSPLQGQVIISKPHNSSNDQMAKAIIILQQPQQQQSQQGNLQQQLQQQQNHNQALVQTPLQQQLQQNISLNKLSGQNTEPIGTEFPYLCEWTGCGQRFNSPTQVFLHASKIHTPETLIDAVRCEWGPNGCDPLLRKRLSLMTHLQDRHCSKHALELSLYRRRNKIEAPPPPQHPTHHPGYAPNAAFHAIKRHAMQFMLMNSKELMDDNEGPVTKSIRLTSALILKNIANYSTMGRRMLKGYESQLASIAMSNVESSRTIAQLLYDMQEINS